MITRFAPSPTGRLHLGHAFSALTVWAVAERAGGTALLRIEDTDTTRCRPEFETAIYDDLAWLGLDWPTPVRRQSDHFDDYAQVIDALSAKDLLYPCSCSRRAIAEAGARPGIDGLVYPGTCRNRPLSDAAPGDALRLDVARALDRVSRPLRFTEEGEAPGLVHVDPELITTRIGDPVLRRKETGDPAYHLACVHDDAVQGVTHVVRGEDLRGVTPLHVLLQALMGWPVPVYHHHRLITDDDGRRLAKIVRSEALSTLRARGVTPDDVRAMVGI